MKKLLVLLLVCMVLTACGGLPEETQSPTLDTTEPALAGLYDETNPVEESTGGAVRAYPLEMGNCTDILSLGDKLVLLSEGEMTLLQGDVCQVAAQLDVPAELSVQDMTVSASDMGIAFYDKENSRIVLLNPMLQESTSYALPETLQGTPVISYTKQYAYYCDGNELRALNLQTGISRLIRTFTEGAVEPVGAYFDGQVLCCTITAGEQTNVVYLSSQDGQTLSEDPNLYNLQTTGSKYFTMRTDGPVTQRIFGKLNGEAMSLNLDGYTGDLVAALSMEGVVGYAADDTGLQLSFYDLTTGLKTSEVRLEGVKETIAWKADSKYVWVVSQGNGNQTLYRWDPSASPVQDETIYAGELFTYQNPDVESLKQLKKRVEQMNQAYGVRISIWEDAVQTSGDYSFKPEHHVPVISAKLDELETVLAQFPKKFLQVTVKAGWIRICLVRSIESGEPFVQYWSGGDCYGAISMDADIKSAFLQCAAYGIDSHVMGNSRDFDTWNQLNPAGFAYGQEVNTKYLEGESRAFVDAQSMENPHQDRSAIIAYAMMEGNAELFASGTMQAKLLRACEGIREAYDLEKSSETYVWEQYLNQSLAYTS